MLGVTFTQPELRNNQVAGLTRRRDSVQGIVHFQGNGEINTSVHTGVIVPFNVPNIVNFHLRNICYSLIVLFWPIAFKTVHCAFVDLIILYN